MTPEGTTPQPVHGTPEWYDREIIGAQEQLAAAQMQIIRAETAIAIFTQERALAVARIEAAQPTPEGGRTPNTVHGEVNHDERTHQHVGDGTG